MIRTRIRPGTSLLEVLVGLGIMAVGAIGAFVLFPLSAINVSRALIDDRATTCAITADGQLRDIHRQVVEGTRGEFYMSDIGLGTLAVGAGPSRPVVIDPMGSRARRGNNNEIWLGDLDAMGNQQTAIPRVNLADLNNPDPAIANPLALRYCSQMDGLTFDDGGKVAPGVDMRELRYNWMWVVQRPVNRDRFTLRMQVVVYDKRTHMYAPVGSEAVIPGTPVAGSAAPIITFVPGTTILTGIPATSEVRKGTWVMDASTTADIAGRLIRHAEFYRVTSVTEEANATLTLELHRPIVRADGLVDRASLPANNPFRYDGTLVIMPAVVEVFERPLLTDNNSNQ